MWLLGVLRALFFVEDMSADLTLCQGNWYYPNVTDFGYTVVTKSVTCDIPKAFLRVGHGDNKLKWKIESKGFHTTIALSFILNSTVDQMNCVWALYVPETSFLDISDAKDRELISPQYPKLHFAPLNFSSFDIQHRYQRVGGDGSIELLPPILFCIDSAGVEQIEIVRPQTFKTSIPVYTGHCKCFIGFITKSLPIVALIFNLIVIAKTFPHEEKHGIPTTGRRE